MGDNPATDPRTHSAWKALKSYQQAQIASSAAVVVNMLDKGFGADDKRLKFARDRLTEVIERHMDEIHSLNQADDELAIEEAAMYEVRHRALGRGRS